MVGQEVTQLISEQLTAGYHQVGIQCKINCQAVFTSTESMQSVLNGKELLLS
jgi:hypothetical protein